MFKKRGFVSAVIVAAGASERFGGDKMFARLGGEPVVLRTLRAFQECRVISEIILVTRTEDMERAASLAQDAGITKLTQVTRGGETRVESVLSGLFAVSKKANVIAVHDGARPLVTQDIIRDAIRGAERYNAAAPAVPVKGTIKQAKGGVVVSTPDREELFEAQTPQVFAAELIRGAIELAVKKGQAPTDDCRAVENIGVTVHLTRGSYENIKITTPEDMIIARAILKSRAARRQNPEPREEITAE
ncbi:MAG: 2-C-methyl-D-erythritol 4-phosphate cytidylyltransferase [Oscillospiraceae bacterium]|jgi:2-C-methyl-D-erythritol 4-phosphate cytidylyltransferase|nr:2-C-methyl-D-erythritol 4-phosphate cytidylyltransferase [Oscillospiraceae bacterium]